MSQRAIIWALIWLGLFAAALMADAPIATFVHAHRWDQKPPGLPSLAREFFKMPGVYPTTILIAAAVAWLHRLHFRAAGFLLLATLPPGLNEPIKWCAGRVRPFKGSHNEWLQSARPFDLHPFPSPIGKMFTTPNMSFPSGHAALAFATAAAMSILFPRGRVGFFFAATCVGIERVFENAHWCSDVVAAAALGVGGVKFVELLSTRGNGLLAEPVDHGLSD